MQKQHVEIHRKLALRQRLLKAASDGAAYVPFIGDGDIAEHCYGDRHVLGIDLDPIRVRRAKQRLKRADIILGDAATYQFRDCAHPVAVMDCDAYSDPWPTLSAAWEQATKAQRVVIFLTDGRMKHFMRSGNFEGQKVDGTNERRKIFNRYPDLVKEKLAGIVAPWLVTTFEFYLRNKQLYVGAIIESPDTPITAEPCVSPSRPRRGNPPGKRQPYKFTDEIRDAYLGKIRSGMRRYVAARAVGVSHQTVCAARREDAAFDHAVIEAELEANDPVEDALYQSAVNGNVTAQQVWLYNRDHERWRDARNIVVSGPGGKPLEVKHVHRLDLSVLSDAELIAYRNAVAKAQGKLIEATEVKP